jgi:hypothetical protein
MNLDEFITATMTQIIKGIKNSQKVAKDNGAKISSASLKIVGAAGGGGIVYYDKSSGEIVQYVEFDIAVTTKEGDKEKGGVGVFVGSFGIGAQAQIENEKSSLNRIKFSIPLYLPKNI